MNIMAVTQVGGLPLDEYTKSCPPGWKENVANYPYRRYLEKLRLWNRITDCEEHQKAATIVGRLKGKANTMAMKTKVTGVVQEVDPATGAVTFRQSVMTGDDAVCAPASPAVYNAAGEVIFPEQLSGLRVMLKKLRTDYTLHDQDQIQISVDDVLDYSRGRATLIEALQDMDLVMDEAEEKAGFAMNDVAKGHFMLKRLKLPENLVDDLKLKIDQDMSRYGELRALILRMAKKEQAASGNGQAMHYANDIDSAWTLAEDGWTWLYYGKAVPMASDDQSTSYEYSSPGSNASSTYYEEPPEGRFEE